MRESKLEVRKLVGSPLRRLRTGTRLLSSAVIAQGAVLMVLLVAARLLDARDFAMYGLAFGVAGLLATANTLGVETRIAVADGPAVASLLRTGATAALVVLCTSAVVVIGAGGLLDIDSLVSLLAGCIAAFLMAWQQMLVMVVLRHGDHRRLARSRMAQGLVNASALAGLLVCPVEGYVALEVAWILSLATCDLVLLQGVPKQYWNFSRASKADLRIARHQVRTQPISNLLVGVAAQAPLILLPALADDGVAGTWALSTRLLSSVFAAAFSTVQPLYYATAARAARESAWSLFARWHGRWTIGLAVGALVMFGSLGLLLAWALPFINPRWDGFEIVIAAASVYWGSLLWSAPLSQSLQLLHAMRAQLLWSCLKLGGTLAGLATIVPYGARAGVLCWASASVLLDGVLFGMQRRALQRIVPLGRPAADTHDD